MTRAINWNKRVATKLWVELEQDQLGCKIEDLLWLPRSSKSLTSCHPLMGVKFQTLTLFPLITVDQSFQPLLLANTFRILHFLHSNDVNCLRDPGPNRTSPIVYLWRATQLRHFVLTRPKPQHPLPCFSTVFGPLLPDHALS